MRNRHPLGSAPSALAARDSEARARHGCAGSHATAPAAKTGNVTHRAGGLVLIALLGVVICSGSAAQADNRGAFGSTSKASIGISVSISPRVHLITAQVETAQTVGALTARGNGSLCLASNMPEGRFTVAIEPIDSDSPVHTSATAVAVNAGTTSRCPLASTDRSQGTTTVALMFGSAAAPQTGLVHLMISPD
jgi:hypothetical protein